MGSVRSKMFILRIAILCMFSLVVTMFWSFHLEYRRSGGERVKLNMYRTQMNGKNMSGRPKKGESIVQLPLWRKRAWSYVDLQLPKEPLAFLPNFKNPCWLEKLNNTPTSTLPGGLSVIEKAGPGTGVVSKLRCLPYFYLAGFPKSATTDLYQRLQKHPQVAPSRRKEPNWWNKSRFAYKRTFSEYLNLFRRASRRIQKNYLATASVPEWHNMITGDASPTTVYDNPFWTRMPENQGLATPQVLTPHQIWRLTPKAKIILMVRNPVDRLYSDYLYFTKTNDSKTSFHEITKTAIEAMKSCLHSRVAARCMYDPEKRIKKGVRLERLRIGMYSSFIEKWRETFPPEQLLVLRTEDYRHNIAETLQKVYSFLGLSPLEPPALTRVSQPVLVNARSSQDKRLGPMLEKTRRLLEEFYWPYNRRLAQLLGDTKFLWN